MRGLAHRAFVEGPLLMEREEKFEGERVAALKKSSKDMQKWR